MLYYYIIKLDEHYFKLIYFSLILQGSLVKLVYIDWGPNILIILNFEILNRFRHYAVIKKGPKPHILPILINLT